MKLVDNLTKEQYNDFFKKSKYNHFLQSYEWGQTCKVRVQTPVYLGMYDDNDTLVAAALLMKKDIPFKMCYYYSPRGVLIDYDDFELVTEFTRLLKEYLKKTKAVYFRVDPGVVYQEIDEEAKPIQGGYNNYKLFNLLLSLGYKHHGFTTLFTKNQPRYTFRINTKKPFKEIEASLNKTYLKTVKRSYSYDLEVTNEYNTETFYNLMKDIANRDNFNGNPKEFFEEFNKNFSDNKSVHYVTIKIYPDKILSKSKQELGKIRNDLESGIIPPKRMADTNNIIARLEKDIEKFTPYENKYPDGLISLILICPTTDRAMWTLYIGNNDLATYTFAVNRSYYEAIKYACDNQFDFLDLFGTCGEPHTTEKNYAGIHEYKRKLGGVYTEFIGEFDIVSRPIWNFMLPTILKTYRKLKKKKANNNQKK